MIALTVSLALVALVAPGGVRPAGATAPPPQVGDIVSVSLNQVGFTNLASLGLDGLTKARGQNGAVTVVGNTAFVGGGALFHGAQASGGRICTDYGGVKVVDITNPAAPVLRNPINIVDTLGAQQGPTTSPRFGKKFDNVSVSAGAVNAMSVTGAMGVNVGGTPFTGDVLAIGIQRCEQSFFSGGRVEFWNVTDPTNPVKVGTFDPPSAPWGIYEDVRMFTRVVAGVPKLYALVTTPFSIGNSHGATTSGDMRVLDITNLATPIQLGTFPNVQIGQSSLNGCKTFLAGRAAAPTPDHNGAILSFYDGSTSVGNLTPGNTASVFKLDLNNLPSAPNDTPPVAFTPQPAHYDT
ncbi:MAG: hypothetical protein M3N98_00020, partial [Actinomycetota bacterium]|nr:hypothetical protein [Actinomycetota bacterium]